MQLPWLLSAAALTLFSSPVAATYHDLVARATGDSVCSPVMCITATLNDSTVQYELTTSSAPGWMAMGFGSSMLGSPMVIMWANSDGKLTLSQRQASAYQEPKVVNSPPRIATVANDASSISGSTIKYAFTIPSDGTTSQNLIWALGLTNPGSPAADATLQQHANMGTLSLDLSKTQSNGTSPTPAIPDRSPSDDIPLAPYQRLIVAHAIFCVVGFLLLLPAGALLARYLRTFTNVWFQGHWIFQVGISGPAIIIGVALGIQAVVKHNNLHLDDNHKKWGVAIFVLYFVQCALGGLIHFLKPSKPKGRPPQNYFHAVLGLLIIALALYQVRTGYKTEWAIATGRGALPSGVNIIWYVWVVLLPVLYAIGLAFLPKQYRQERESRSSSTEDSYMAGERYED